MVQQRTPTTRSARGVPAAGDRSNAGRLNVAGPLVRDVRYDRTVRTRRLGIPRRVAVVAADDGQPLTVDGREVESVRESWLLEDRWWTERPLRRRYWEVITVCGRNEVVFHDLRSARWWRQRA